MKKLILASILGLVLSGSYVMADCNCDKCKTEQKCDGHKGKKCDCQKCGDKGHSCEKH